MYRPYSPAVVSTTKTIRPIDKRYKPPVRGIDLWQALNYISLSDVTLEFIYNRYTSSVLVYQKGSRPKLEKIARECTKASSGEFDRISALARYVAENVQWASYHEHKNRKKLPGDRLCRKSN